MKFVLPLVLDFKKSIGSYLYDKESGEKYLDFFSLYSSLPLGYNHPIFDEDFKDEILTVSHIRMANNVCKTTELLEFSEIFSRYTFSNNLHFTCTGALAIESAIKAAMHKKKITNPKVISVVNSFHGVNSWGFATSRVGVTAKRMEYFPENNWLKLSLQEIIKYLNESDLSDLAAVLIEPIQCSNGDVYADPESLREINKLCGEKNICFIIDEIQTGFGVTGSMWYYQTLGLNPDILVFGKKSQVCGICTNEKYSEILFDEFQKLDVTFDGELIDMIRCKYILKAIENKNLLDMVSKNSEKIRSGLEDKVLNYRSIGHLIAFDFTSKDLRDRFVQACYQNRLLVNKTGEYSVRLRPNLALTENELTDFLYKIGKSLNDYCCL